MGTAEFDPNTAGGRDGAEDGAVDTVDTAPKRAAAAPAPAPAGAMYTMLAREGVNAASLVNASLAKRTLGKQTPRRLEVAAPLGQSTSGGKKARQSVTLVSVSGDGAAVMCGWIDAAQKTGELRDFRALAEQYQARFGMPFDATVEEYFALMKDLEGMLKVLGFKITNAQVEPPRATKPVATPSAAGKVAVGAPHAAPAPARAPAPSAGGTAPAAPAAAPAARQAKVAYQPLASPPTESSALKTAVWVIAAAIGGGVIALALMR